MSRASGRQQRRDLGGRPPARNPAERALRHHPHPARRRRGARSWCTWDCSAYRVHAATGTARPCRWSTTGARPRRATPPGPRRPAARGCRTSHPLGGDDRGLGRPRPQVLDAPDPLAPGDALVLCSDGLDRRRPREHRPRCPGPGRAPRGYPPGGAGQRPGRVRPHRRGRAADRARLRGPRRRRAMWAEDLSGAWEAPRGGHPDAPGRPPRRRRHGGATLVARSMAVARRPRAGPSHAPAYASAHAGANARPLANAIAEAGAVAGALTAVSNSAVGELVGRVIGPGGRYRLLAVLGKGAWPPSTRPSSSTSPAR